MPSSAISILDAAGLLPAGVVRWGASVPENGPGVYLVSTEPVPVARSLGPRACPIDISAVERLLVARAELTVEGGRPSPSELVERLCGAWLPDENVLYIGLAGTSLRKRVGQYYRTELGARSPHAGGWFLKTLTVLPELFVHFSPTGDPETAESQMIGAFCAGVSEETKVALLDPAHPFPFANLEWPRGRRKRHGVKGAKQARAQRRSGPRPTPEQVKAPSEAQAVPIADTTVPHLRTQRITAADIGRGQIRVPRGASKKVLPAEPAQLVVRIRGSELRCRWNPRYGPPERSGIIGIGKRELAALVVEDEVLRIGVSDECLELS